MNEFKNKIENILKIHGAKPAEYSVFKNAWEIDTEFGIYKMAIKWWQLLLISI